MNDVCVYVCVFVHIYLCVFVCLGERCMRARVHLFSMKAKREREGGKERESDTSHDACHRKRNRMANRPNGILPEILMVDLYRSILHTPSTCLPFFRPKNATGQLSLRGLRYRSKLIATTTEVVVI